MSKKIDDLFDSLNGNFIARLREIYLNTRTTADGKATITFRTARIEAVYSPDIVRHIEAGRLFLMLCQLVQIAYIRSMRWQMYILCITVG
jgi:hypothetical protein